MKETIHAFSHGKPLRTPEMRLLAILEGDTAKIKRGRGNILIIS
jgi:hypothetical protein